MTVTGSGNVTSETRPLADWTAVALACPGTLDLQIGPNQGITIEAEDNILPLIETRVDGGGLQIRFQPAAQSIRPTQPIRFRAATPAIDGLAVSGSGSIHAPAIEGATLTLGTSGSGSIDVASASTGALDARISGSGSVTVRGDTRDCDVRVSGSGDLNARDLACHRAHVNVSGSGSVMLRVEREIEGRISGSGSIVYSGQPVTSIRTSGSGRAVQMPG
ncbi:MAG TPA: head GIN domain-containing protein [Thermomicrobiales bacterium]|nr:head GIN domain-containing protein [Thermomicrobiales bacterium]